MQQLLTYIVTVSLYISLKNSCILNEIIKFSTLYNEGTLCSFQLCFTFICNLHANEIRHHTPLSPLAPSHEHRLPTSTISYTRTFYIFPGKVCWSPFPALHIQLIRCLLAYIVMVNDYVLPAVNDALSLWTLYSAVNYRNALKLIEVLSVVVLQTHDHALRC